MAEKKKSDVVDVRFASVALENTSFVFDKTFDYLISDELKDRANIGCRVLVGFGKSNKTTQGIIFDIKNSSDIDEGKCKKILKVIDDEPILSQELIEIAKYVSDRFFCSPMQAAKAMIPTGMSMEMNVSFMISPEVFDETLLLISEQEKPIVEYLKKRNEGATADKIYKTLKIDPETKAVESLFNKGFLIKNTNTFRKIHDVTEKYVSLTDDVKQNGLQVTLTKKQQAVVDFLTDASTATTAEIAYYTGLTRSVTENLYAKGIVEYTDIQSYRTPSQIRNTERNDEKIVLTEKQKQAFEPLLEKLRAGKFSSTLLHGVTGSGKTSVYMSLIDSLEKGDGVIVLGPEISLTPQILEKFAARYGDRVALVHSGLSVGQRTDEFKRIKTGKADIVIGTRSAVFAPINNLKLIIVDEEQESSYKSEMTPRYNAVQVAQYRCKINDCMLLCSTATPSVVSYARAKQKKDCIVTLDTRYNSLCLPEVITVDTSDRQEMNGLQTISSTLAQHLRQNLENNEQSILLLNRRGYNTFISCTKCKKVVQCPNCSISLTYHSANNRMMCHYCGYSEQFNAVCPSCGGQTVSFSGFGTQKVVSELEYLFPEMRILRVDADTTTGKDAHEKKFKQFSDGKFDCMVGTQMVAKGLNFPNVTLVGVISVDTQLYNDDYLSAEKTFNLLTQVIGRAGRGEKKGRAVIQTMQPGNDIIEMASRQDYEQFFSQEIVIRKAMIYPPYCDMCEIVFKGKIEEKTREASVGFFKIFKQAIESNPDVKVVVLGPISPKVSKIKGLFIQKIIIKCKNNAQTRDLILNSLKEYSANPQFSKIRVYADMNPI